MQLTKLSLIAVLGVTLLSGCLGTEQSSTVTPLVGVPTATPRNKFSMQKARNNFQKAKNTFNTAQNLKNRLRR
ncbi:hypothetical protein EON83_20335 [bacterium]|nr:MAG: hypothetical protein EON83_20335 [bacterium]